jgi:hypothetical protein
MHFVVGKRYVAKCGCEVRIYAVDGMPPYSIHGAYKGKEHWHSCTWAMDGSYIDKEKQDLDIKGESNPSINFDWSCLAAWQRYIAKDEISGMWNAFSSLPAWNPEKQRWMETCAPGFGALIPKRFCPTYDGLPEDSLFERPAAITDNIS